MVSSSHLVPGDGLLHPVPILAICLMVANDHALKQLSPGIVTGKLSDLAGLIFFPLFLQAVWETLTSAIGRPVVANRRILLVSVIATGLVFSAAKLVAEAGDAYRVGLGALQWFVAGPALLLGGNALGAPQAVHFTADLTDLVVLPALAIAWFVGSRRTHAGRFASP